MITIERVGEFKVVSPETLQKYDLDKEDVVLPERATGGSAGYDLCATANAVIEPHKMVMFPLGVKVKIKDGWYLQIVPRSSIGIKKHLMLANGTGIIDAKEGFAA